ncbi:hypothetical protein M885DRAFT_504733 [Pelagophyceae sp. CCMP2097]|nr:hypothetical protein M885DRAFT_504733 [Pelagophyceae sp. CCMP2097]|eukprot:CAMPEP_0184085170 /NCGR_PEP_ID=MMETSP0974-20121125/4573_1 /TAXON_ID=483370 /ORGANISM="non described non described, Strain CCMP2097" /LENGTH=147 /DNA_ID=CAMNT_0026387847 /DNA_START=91 /DNA_END=534 /DNA_ORIENTATION=+
MGYTSGPKRLSVVCAVALVSSLGWLLAAREARALRRARGTPPAGGAFVLVVELEFKSIEDRDAAVAAIKPVAAHCRANEPGTLTYEISFSDSDPLKVLFIERYADKETAFLAVHKTSAPFLKFRPVLAKLAPKITGQSYIASDIGYF